MGKSSTPNPNSLRCICGLLAMMVWLGTLAAQPTRATVVPLLLPAGIVYDSAGTLYLAETNAHQVLAVSPAGTLTVIAGSGIQGYAGDRGSAVSARLDSPSALALSPTGALVVADTHNHVIRRIQLDTGSITTIAGTGQPGSSPDGTLASSALLDQPVALAFDAAGDLYFADARAHLIRRIDVSTGLLSTVAGSGRQGYSGDGGPALAAALDSPSGLAVDGSGAIFLADTHNQRIRRIDPATHLITSIAGTGSPGFSGDGSAATSAGLHLPRGLAIDSSGGLILVDTRNERIRRVDPVSGVISTVAGTSVQGFAGDGSAAVSALLNTPRAVTLSPAGLVTLADSANGRVRQIDSAALIHTIAGLGDTTGSVLNLSGPTVVSYGTGTLTATLAASPATGLITFLDTSGAQPTTLAAVLLSANLATFSTAALQAGTHTLTSTYSGDATHSSAQSPTVSLTVSPATLLATPSPAAILYGQPVPALTATLSGLLPADATRVSLVLGSAATPTSPPAAYPITGALTGAAAGNYSLSLASASVTISQAPSIVTLATAGGYSAHVTSTTSGTPTGSVTLLEGSQSLATSTLVAGFASFNPTLTAGVHTLSALYAGDVDFLASASTASAVTVNPGPAPDFTLAAAGQTAQTIPAGSAASYAFSLNPVNGGLASAIQLSVAGLPVGATASFNPAYIPPGGAVTSTILTIQTLHATLLPWRFNPLQPVLALLLPLCLIGRIRRRRSLVLSVLCTLTLLTLTACGDRVSTSGQATPIKPYTLTITGTATAASGAVVQHSTTVTLNVQ